MRDEVKWEVGIKYECQVCRPGHKKVCHLQQWQGQVKEVRCFGGDFSVEALVCKSEIHGQQELDIKVWSSEQRSENTLTRLRVDTRIQQWERISSRWKVEKEESQALGDLPAFQRWVEEKEDGDQRLRMSWRKNLKTEALQTSQKMRFKENMNHELHVAEYDVDEALATGSWAFQDSFRNVVKGTDQISGLKMEGLVREWDNWPGCQSEEVW